MSRLLRGTSLAAYQYLMESGELSRMEEVVIRAFFELGGQATNRQIADHLKIAINRVTGRTRKLYQKGKIEKDKQIKNPKSNCLNWRWKLVK